VKSPHPCDSAPGCGHVGPDCSSPTKRSISCKNIEHNGTCEASAKPHALALAQTVLHTHTHTHRNQRVTYENISQTHQFCQSLQAVIWGKAVCSHGHLERCMIIEAPKVKQNEHDVKGFLLSVWFPADIGEISQKPAERKY